MQILCWI